MQKATLAKPYLCEYTNRILHELNHSLCSPRLEDGCPQSLHSLLDIFFTEETEACAYVRSLPSTRQKYRPWQRKYAALVCLRPDDALRVTFLAIFREQELEPM